MESSRKIFPLIYKLKARHENRRVGWKYNVSVDNKRQMKQNSQKIILFQPDANIPRFSIFLHGISSWKSSLMLIAYVDQQDLALIM